MDLQECQDHCDQHPDCVIYDYLIEYRNKSLFPHDGANKFIVRYYYREGYCYMRFTSELPGILEVTDNRIIHGDKNCDISKSRISFLQRLSEVRGQLGMTILSVTPGNPLL